MNQWRKYIIGATVALILCLLFVASGYLSGRAVQTNRLGGAQAVNMLAADTLRRNFGISPYDHIFREVGLRHNIDWRLLAAMAYCESHFRPDVVSSRGATGLMQVMPHIARAFGVDSVELTRTDVNVDVAARVYRSMRRMLQLPREIAERDAIAFTVASYNCGASRLIDARNLAAYYGENANEWESVREYLLLLSEEEFYNHEAVKGGRFGRPKMTATYVRKVLKQYDRYCRRAER